MVNMKKMIFFTSKEIKPRGWLKRQLEIQASGLSGNLDKVWRDVRDSAWIGGEAEGWERVPYWLERTAVACCDAGCGLPGTIWCGYPRQLC